jgi:hypothetical protein
MRVVVAPLREFPPGERRIVTAGSRSIGVFRIEAASATTPSRVIRAFRFTPSPLPPKMGQM